METEIMVQVSMDVATALQTGRSDLAGAIQGLGARIEPLHPNTPDPELQRFFVVYVPSADEADRVINRLWQYPGVEAAYVKPAGEPP
jgi:hypothetical protein